MVPLFTGHLNFIASPEENYWYLCVRNQCRGNVPETWPRLIFSQDIAKVSKFIERKLSQVPELTTDDLFMEVRNTMRVNSVKTGEPLKQIGREHVWTPVTNDNREWRLQLE